VAVATKMPIEELSLALAIYTSLHGDPPAAVRRHLDPTPRAHFAEACAWAKSNASLVSKIRDDPATIQEGGYALSEARGWLARLFGLGRAKNADDADDQELERVAREMAAAQQPLDEGTAQQRAELRRLVDDAFDAS
jgi:hypothetical protein